MQRVVHHSEQEEDELLGFEYISDLMLDYEKHCLSVRALVEYVQQTCAQEGLIEKVKQLEHDAADYKARALQSSPVPSGPVQ